ncbi:F-box domain [Dillenia turbinata]|uniref:F-box domain n=1 Tax=Dillenia turbinata TaxID=194707 RepID=A0AAN8ZD81_9MAGN
MESRKKTSKGPTTVYSLGHDTLCMIFSLLDLFDLVRSTLVCKSWYLFSSSSSNPKRVAFYRNTVINGSKLLHIWYYKHQLRSTGLSNMPTISGELLKIHPEEQALEYHRLGLQEGAIHIDQWKGHSIGVDHCSMKMGLILTGGGDKVIRLWSSESYKVLEEHLVPDRSRVIDFDFDECKIVGLIGTQLCIWRRQGRRSIFPSSEGTFAKGLCMRYADPEAVVGCEDGAARVFDMYNQKCSQIIRMHAGPLTCLCLTDSQMIISGSSAGRITISGLSGDGPLATMRAAPSLTGIRTLCFNPRSHLVFAGTNAGHALCWDIRMMRSLWETRVSPNVVFSMQHQRNDVSSLVVGGIDGILRVMNQDTGEVVSRCIIDGTSSSSLQTHGIVQRKRGRRISEDTQLDQIPKSARPPITCLAVGMKKVVTTHNGKNIRLWRFSF